MKMKQNSLDIANPVYDRFTLFILKILSWNFITWQISDILMKGWPADDDN